MGDQGKRRFRIGREVEERYRYRVPGFENAKEVYRFDEPDEASAPSGGFRDPENDSAPPWSDEWVPSGEDLSGESALHSYEEGAESGSYEEDDIPAEAEAYPGAAADAAGSAGTNGAGPGAGTDGVAPGGADAAKRPSDDTTSSFEELLAAFDEQTGSETYPESADDIEVSQEEVDELVRDELAKRGFLGRQMHRVLDPVTSDEDIYLERDLVSENDPLIASIEEEVRRKTEEEARESLKLSKREERARLAAEKKAEAERKAAEKAAEKRGAESQIEAERRMIAEIREAEAAARRKEEKRIAKKKKRALRAEKRRNRSKGPLGLIFRIPIFILAFALFLFLLTVTMRFLGKSELLNTRITTSPVSVPEGGELLEDDTVLWKDTRYRYDKSLTNILFLGLDPEADRDRIVDSLFLVSADTSNGKMSLISISADTETDVDIYGKDGVYQHTKKAPLSSAYAAAGGGKQGCVNTAEAVSVLLNGIPVNAYFALDLRAAGGLADAVGGIDAVVTEDFGARYIEETVGDTVVLRGDTAGGYLRSLSYADPEDYEKAEQSGDRLARQKSFLSGFLKRVKRDIRENPLLPFYLMNYLAKRSFTNLNFTRLVYLSWTLYSGSSEADRAMNLPGSAEKTESGMKYVPDRKAVWDAVLEVFYEPVNK